MKWLSLTVYMCFHKRRDLVQGQLCNVDLAQPLLECASAMCDYLEDLSDKSLIRSDLRVPGINKLFDYTGKKGIKLTVDVIGAREGR